MRGLGEDFMHKYARSLGKTFGCPVGEISVKIPQSGFGEQRDVKFGGTCRNDQERSGKERQEGASGAREREGRPQTGWTLAMAASGPPATTGASLRPSHGNGELSRCGKGRSEVMLLCRWLQVLKEENECWTLPSE